VYISICRTCAAVTPASAAIGSGAGVTAGAAVTAGVGDAGTGASAPGAQPARLIIISAAISAAVHVLLIPVPAPLWTIFFRRKPTLRGSFFYLITGTAPKQRFCRFGVFLRDQNLHGIRGS
jgi:hypothetical protein